MVRSYTWGLDIARTLSDAGGVGALLQIADHASGKAYFPSYDGNGNVVALFNSASGTLAAAYEYSPYGEPLRAQTNDTIVADQPFRFSTKYTDLESGLVYYGRRYYDPRTGRWLCRDPKEELGGLHLYGLVGNNPTNKWDFLGFQMCLGDDDDGSGDISNEPFDPTWSSFAVWDIFKLKSPAEQAKTLQGQVLKVLCGTAAGRVAVDQINDGYHTVNLFSLNSKIGGFQGDNEIDVNIFSGDVNAIASNIVHEVEHTAQEAGDQKEFQEDIDTHDYNAAYNVRFNQEQQAYDAQAQFEIQIGETNLDDPMRIMKDPNHPGSYIPNQTGIDQHIAAHGIPFFGASRTRQGLTLDK